MKYQHGNRIAVFRIGDKLAVEVQEGQQTVSHSLPMTEAEVLSKQIQEIIDDYKSLPKQRG